MTKHWSNIGHSGLRWAGLASTPGVGDLMVESGYVPLSTGFAQGPSSPLKTLFPSTFLARFCFGFLARFWPGSPGSPLGGAWVLWGTHRPAGPLLSCLLLSLLLDWASGQASSMRHA